MNTVLLMRLVALCVVVFLSVSGATYTYAFPSFTSYSATMLPVTQQGIIVFVPTGQGKHPNKGTYTQYTACEAIIDTLTGSISHRPLGYGFYWYSDGDIGYWGDWATPSAAGGEEVAEDSSPSFLSFHGSTLQVKGKMPDTLIYGDKFYDVLPFTRPTHEDKETSPNTTTALQPEKLADIIITGDAVEIHAKEHIIQVQIIEATSGKVIHTSAQPIARGSVIRFQKPASATGLCLITVHGYSEATKEKLQTSRGFLIR